MPSETRGISHGICAPCAADVLADLDQLCGVAAGSLDEALATNAECC
jgi:hypothetical protein